MIDQDRIAKGLLPHPKEWSIGKEVWLNSLKHGWRHKTREWKAWEVKKKQEIKAKKKAWKDNQKAKNKRGK